MVDGRATDAGCGDGVEGKRVGTTDDVAFEREGAVEGEVEVAISEGRETAELAGG